jgi:hypothetical protein
MAKRTTTTTRSTTKRKAPAKKPAAKVAPAPVVAEKPQPEPKTEMEISLQGVMPFARVHLPGSDPAIVITREPQRISHDDHKRFLAAIKEGKLPGLTAENVSAKRVRV